jgi:hypothetical protein
VGGCSKERDEDGPAETLSGTSSSFIDARSLSAPAEGEPDVASGYRPECIRRSCRFLSHVRVKDSSQTEHLCAFKPKWAFMWPSRFRFVVNAVPQIEHTNRASCIRRRAEAIATGPDVTTALATSSGAGAVEGEGSSRSELGPSEPESDPEGGWVGYFAIWVPRAGADGESRGRR